MKVQSIQSNINFEAKKPRYIGLESQEQLIQILRKMDNETVYKSNDYSFESTKTTRLRLFNHDKNEQLAELIDTRKNLKKLPEGNDMFNETLLTIGKTQLVIDNKTGKIIDWDKPFFSTWKGIMKKINDVLIRINATYHNPDYVKKHRFSIEGFTKQGYEKLQKLLKTK